MYWSELILQLLAFNKGNNHLGSQYLHVSLLSFIYYISNWSTNKSPFWIKRVIVVQKHVSLPNHISQESLRGKSITVIVGGVQDISTLITGKHQNPLPVLISTGRYVEVEESRKKWILRRKKELNVLFGITQSVEIKTWKRTKET